MLAETSANATIEIYRCEAFPLRWRLHKVLLERISAFDATLWKQNDRWWMFERADPFEENLVKAPAKRERLATVNLDRSVLRRLRQHVQRAVPAENERIREVVGPLENDLRFAGLGILENFHRHNASLRGPITPFLEEYKVSALVFDGKWIGPGAVLAGHQIAQSLEPAALLVLVRKVKGQFPMVQPTQ